MSEEHLSNESQSVMDSRQSPAEGSSNAHVSAVPGRPSNACLRCKGRKTKCSYERPKCAGCVKANVECQYPSLMANRPTWDYVRQLEAKVKAMEENFGHEKAFAETGTHTHDGHASNEQPNKRLRLSASNSNPNPLPFPQTAATTFTDHTMWLSGPEPVSPVYDLKPTSGSSHIHMPTSQLGRHQNHRPPSFSQLFDHIPRDDQLDSISFEQLPKPSQAAEVMISPYLPFDQSILPSPDILEQHVGYFHTYMSSGYLLVHEPTLLDQIRRVQEDDNPEPSDCFAVLMVLAVSCTSQARGLPNSSDLRRQAATYWQAAQPYSDFVLEQSGIGKLQAIHLALQYVLHNPEAGNIWDLTGRASRTVTDLGLHRESQSAHRMRAISPGEQDLRRKLFWATYCIDRNLSTALGRPPGISDEWINTRFPSTFVDSCITETGITPGPIDPRKEGAIHHAHLRILQSEIHHRLYTIVASTSAPPSAEWFTKMEKRIGTWRSGYAPDTKGFQNVDWLELQYHITRCLLFRPTPGNRNPSRANLTCALQSSSVIMRLYREMWRRRNINYIWQAIHHLFMSGVTYLNSLWIASKNGWDIVPSFVESLLDIQACSSSLEAMTLNEHGTTGIRDAFEKVSAAVIRRLSNKQAAIPESPARLNGLPGGTVTNLGSAGIDVQQGPLSRTLYSSDQTSAEMDFSWLMDPSRPASPSNAAAGQPDDILDSFLFHDLAGLDTGLVDILGGVLEP